MTVPALFEFAKTGILLLSVTALILAFVFMYASEAKKEQN